MPLSTWLQRWLCLSLCLAVVPGAAQPAADPGVDPAQPPEIIREPLQGEIRRPTAPRPTDETTFPTLEGTRFHWHDQPVLLTYAFGLRDKAQLDDYANVGFNTVYIDLCGDAEADAAARELAQAASDRGLALIVGLNAIQAAGGPGPFTTADRARLLSTEAWLTETVAAWREQKGVVAWALQHEAEERLTWVPEHFTVWLDQQYGSALNQSAAWGRELREDVAATPDLATALDAERPGHCGRPTVDVARWQATNVTWLLRGWERAIHAADPTRPVLGGRMSRARTMLVAPEELAGLQPSMVPAPGVVVDPYELAAFGSQAGRYAPLVCLDANAPADTVRRLALRAASRGIAGLSFSDWTTFAADPLRVRATTATLAELATVQAAAFEQRGCSAIVMSPWARGPLRNGPGFYGYCSIGGDEPAGLLDLLRAGTRFGPLDVVAPRDLMAGGGSSAPSAYRLDLSGYGCLFVPAAWFLNDGEVARLAQFAESGGTVIADYGVASEGFRGVEPSMSLAAAALFGVAPRRTCDLFEAALSPALRARMRKVAPGEDPLSLLPPGDPGPGALVIDTPFELCPRLRTYDTVSRRSARLQLLQPATFALPLTGTRVIGTQCQLGARLPTEAPVAGLFSRAVGHGHAVYASSPLWAALDRDDPLFDALHEGLLSRRSPIETVVDAAPGQATWAARGDGRVWLDRVLPQAGLVAVDLPELEGQVYTNGLNVIRRAQRAGLTGAEPLVNRLVTTLEAGELRCETLLPMTLWPLGPSAAAQVTAYGPKGVELWLYGAGSEVTADQPVFGIATPAEAEFILTLHSGDYPIEPGSLHRVEMRSDRMAATTPAPHRPGGGASTGTAGIGATGTEYRTVNADPEGRLVLHGMVQAARIRIKPASARWEE